MKKSDEYRLSKEADYAKMMSESLLAVPREKIPASTTQCASTQESLNTTDEQYAAKVKKMFESGSWKAPVFTEEQMLERLHKTYGLDMVNKLESDRRKSRNTLGESKKSSASDERKERAKDVWNFTPPAPPTPEEKLQIKQIEEKKPEPIAPVVREEWRELTNWQAFVHWCKGGKLKVEDKK